MPVTFEKRAVNIWRYSPVQVPTAFRSFERGQLQIDKEIRDEQLLEVVVV